MVILPSRPFWLQQLEESLPGRTVKRPRQPGPLLFHERSGLRRPWSHPNDNMRPDEVSATDGDVCAVIYGDPHGPVSEALSRAIEAQGAPPAIVLRAQGLSAGARAAAATGAAWVWLLDGWTVPAPHALAELLLIAHGADEPVLVASKVLDEQGRISGADSLRHEVFEKEHSVLAAERGLVQLRTAAHGSVLVTGEALRRSMMPRADLPPGVDMLEWSARLLRSWEDIGYLVPASVAVRHSGPTPAPGWLERARLLTGPAWTPTEKLWETFLLGQTAAVAIRGRGQGRKAVGAPGRNPSRSPRRTTDSEPAAKRLKRR